LGFTVSRERKPFKHSKIKKYMGKGTLVIAVGISVIILISIFAIVIAPYAREKAEEERAKRAIRETFEEVAEDYEESEQKEMLVVENQILENGKLDICIRNAISRASTIDAVYKNGMLIASNLNILLSGDSVTCFDLPGSYNVEDDVMLVTLKGTQLKFEVKG
jgi:hypothetical protein